MNVAKHLTDLLDNPLVEAEGWMGFRVKLAGTELIELRLRGGQDDDGDMKPEFEARIQVLNRDVLPKELGTIELDPKLVLGAAMGQAGSIAGLARAVSVAVEEKGLDLSDLLKF